MKPSTAVMLAASLVSATACDRPNRKDALERDKPGPQVFIEREDSVARVNANAVKLEGQKVTMNGALTGDDRDLRVHTLTDRDPSRERITLLTRSPVMLDGQPVGRDAHVVVTGTVRRFTPTLEHDLGWDVPSDLEKQLDGRTVLVASEIRRLDPPTSQWSDPRSRT